MMANGSGDIQGRNDLVQSGLFPLKEFCRQAEPTLNRDNWRTKLAYELDTWRGAAKGEVLGKIRGGNPVGGLLPVLSKGQRVIDIGCGPVPVEVRDLDNTPIEVIGVDPLADEYRGLFGDDASVDCDRMLTLEGERLMDKFASNAFDLVVCSRSLDRSYDPVAFVANAVAVCKVGGTMVFVFDEVWNPLNRFDSSRSWSVLRVLDDIVLWRSCTSLSLRRLIGEDVKFEFVESESDVLALRVTLQSKKWCTEPNYTEIYDKIYSSVATYSTPHTSPGLRTALQHSDKILMEGRQYLDIGAGPGYLVEVMAMPPFRKLSRGVDISAVAVKLAEERLGPGRVLQINKGELCFSDNEFDLVTCFDVLEHLDIDDVLQLMREIRRVAKRGGLGMFNISLRDSYLRDINGDSVHRTILTAAEWDGLMVFDNYTVSKRESELYGEIRF